MSAGFHAAARHRYNGVNSADLAAGVRALVAELAAFRPHHVALRADGARAYDGPAAQLFLSNLRCSASASTSTRWPTPPTAGWRPSSSTRAPGATSCGCWPRRAQGTHLERDGVRWSRATRVQIESPLPLVADAQPLGVTTATVTVAAGRLRLIAPEARA